MVSNLKERHEPVKSLRIHEVISGNVFGEVAHGFDIVHLLWQEIEPDGTIVWTLVIENMN